MIWRGIAVSAVSCWMLMVVVVAAAQSSAPASSAPAPRAAVDHESLFLTSGNCLACHNGLTTSRGEDISIATAWRSTMMANSSRDPYWRASVRRETIDHPGASDAIEDECSTCHMPMSHTSEHAAGQSGKVFEHLAADGRGKDLRPLAADGVSCAMCHQIQSDRLGTPASFTGGFVVDTTTPIERRPMFGPYAVDAARTTIMRSATGMVPTESQHVRQAELCATCHTLYTDALGPDGKRVGTLPEQVPFLEWKHSEYRASRTCQACHMPVVQEDTQMSSVLGDRRSGVSRHTFPGGNFFMLRMLNRYRADLDVVALPEELERNAAATIGFLRRDTARLAIDMATMEAGRLTVEVSIENLAGHKFPTGYPSRRAWLHLVARADNGEVIFESGRVTAEGLIEGNDNDTDASQFEPHYTEIKAPEEVLIYESILGEQSGRVTTGLLTAVDYLKDNRLLPRGFDKTSADRDIAVRGDASLDADFVGGSDRIRYSIDTAGSSGPFTVEVELLFTPIGFRWARNLESYPQDEPARFTRYYREMAAGASTVVARSQAVVR